MGGYIIVAASITDGVRLDASPDLREYIGAKVCQIRGEVCQISQIEVEIIRPYS